jgi:hypothetical protein
MKVKMPIMNMVRRFRTLVDTGVYFGTTRHTLQAVSPLVLLRVVDMSASQYEFRVLIYNDLSFVFINQNILPCRHVISVQVIWYIPSCVYIEK